MGNNAPIIVEQIYNAPIAMVWKAITDKNQMRQWFFENIEAFKAEVGFQTQFNVVNGDKNYLHIWKIADVVPMKKITCNWKFRGYSGNSFVTFELFPENNKTRLRLTNEGQETFPQDNPDFSRESCLEGWNYFIAKRLKEFLENEFCGESTK